MKDQTTNLRNAEIARKTQPGFLYYFTYEGGSDNFFTSYDLDITIQNPPLGKWADPQIFTSAQISHSPFVEDSEVKSNPISVSLAATDVALRKYFLTAPSRQIDVEIYRLNSSTLPGPINYADLYMDFKGVCVSVGFKSYMIQASFLPPVLKEDRQVPAFFYQKTCNHKLYGKYCGLTQGAWTNTSTITGVNRVNKTVDIADLTVGTAAKTITKETFQGGMVVDSAGNKIGIIAGEMLPSAAGVRLWLNYWPGTMFVGGTIAVSAGCLKIVRICDRFFGNAGNFGGTPCIPITNPVLNGIIT